MIVFCTGFSHDVRKEAIKIVGPEVGEKLDEYWGLDDEGELRGVYKPHGRTFFSHPLTDSKLTHLQSQVFGILVEE